MEASFAPGAMFPVAVVDSIDTGRGDIVGVSERGYVLSVLIIGLTTFVFSVVGVEIGNRFGARYKAKAEAAGGIILLLMGALTLLEHLRV